MTFTQKLLYGLVGFLIGNTLLVTLGIGVHFYSRYSRDETELTFDTALSETNSPELKEIQFKGDTVIFKKENQREVFYISTESQRELLLKNIDERNKISLSNTVTTIEEPAPSMGYFQMINFWIFPTVIMLGIPLIIFLLFLILLRKNSNNHPR